MAILLDLIMILVVIPGPALTGSWSVWIDRHPAATMGWVLST
jgi:hypothetical protein